MSDLPPEETGAADAGDPSPDIFEVRITGTADEISEILKLPGLDVGCRRPHIDRNADGTEILYALAPAASVAAWRAAGYRVEAGANITILGRSLQHEVGVGDRFEGGRLAPTGLGIKTNDPRGRSA